MYKDNGAWAIRTKTGCRCPWTSVRTCWWLRKLRRSFSWLEQNSTSVWRQRRQSSAKRRNLQKCKCPILRWFLLQTDCGEIEQNNGRLIRQLNPKCVDTCKGQHWNEMDRQGQTSTTDLTAYKPIPLLHIRINSGSWSIKCRRQWHTVTLPVYI